MENLNMKNLLIAVFIIICIETHAQQFKDNNDELNNIRKLLGDIDEPVEKYNPAEYIYKVVDKPQKVKKIIRNNCKYTLYKHSIKVFSKKNIFIGKRFLFYLKKNSNIIFKVFVDNVYGIYSSTFTYNNKNKNIYLTLWEGEQNLGLISSEFYLYEIDCNQKITENNKLKIIGNIAYKTHPNLLGHLYWIKTSLAVKEIKLNIDEKNSDILKLILNSNIKTTPTEILFLT
jgi:hypothetical protein